MLIFFGHVDAWDYGYSYFKTVLKTLERLQKEFIRLQAIAIGLALSGKKEDWDKLK